MSDLHIREEKIKEKRKSTSWREFLMEIASRSPMVFHKNNGMISKYPTTQRIGEIINTKKYAEVRDSFTEKGRTYDNNMTFMQNFEGLFKNMPFPNMVNIGNIENTEYAETIVNSKNIYLSNTVINSVENVCYSFSIKDHSMNIFNSVMVRDNSQNVYFGSGIINSYNIFYSKCCVDSSDIWFSTNLVGCHDCIFCNNLENSPCCIENKQYTKEEYLLRKQEILHKKNDFPNLYIKISSLGGNIGSRNVQGNILFQSEDITNSLLCYNAKTGKNLILVGSHIGAENVYDCMTGGSPSAKDLYGIMGSGNSEKVFCSINMDTGSNNYYSNNILACSYCLGCIGIQNKSFCILNKQYTKEERFELANKIFEQMDKEGTLGKFFPGSMNPFYFNDTVAYLIDDSFTKEEVTAAGYLWRDEEIKVDIPAGVDVVETQNLASRQGYDDQGKRHINPDILKKVIKDQKGNYYRIVPLELEFLQKYGLPLPEIHWLERIKLGFKFK